MFLTRQALVKMSSYALQKTARPSKPNPLLPTCVDVSKGIYGRKYSTEDGLERYGQVDREPSKVCRASRKVERVLIFEKMVRLVSREFLHAKGILV